jgi:hypothetical protein
VKFKQAKNMRNRNVQSEETGVNDQALKNYQSFNPQQNK